MQELAAAASESGLQSPCIVQLANIGSAGNHPGNCHRDLIRILPKQPHAPVPYEIMVPMKSKHNITGAMETKELPQHIVLPTDWFASMDDSGFASKLLGDIDACGHFWDKILPDDPKFNNNPYFDDPSSKHGCVPLFLFGDGASHAEHDSVTAVSIKSLLVDSAIADSMLLLAAVPKSATKQANEPDSCTWHRIWQVLCWNFAFLAKGIHPTTDHQNNPWPAGSLRAQKAGKPLCPVSGIHAVIWVIGGDYEYMELEYGLKHHSSNTPCSWCNCNVSDTPWNDFSIHALWKATVKSSDAFRAEPPLHQVLNIPGVVFEMFALDVLHCLDLGVSSHVFGNLFNDIIVDHLHMTRPRALEELNKLIHQEYNALGIPASSRIPHVTFSHYRNTPYPCLTHIKGSRIRVFAPVALALAERFRDDDDRRTLHRLMMVRALCTCYECIHLENEVVWPADVFSKFQKAMVSFLAHYHWLARWSMTTAGKEYRYSMVTKHHYAAHFEQQAKYLSPRLTWTYGGETFMGLVASLTQACVRGRKSTIVGKAVVKKFIYAKMLRLSGLVDVSQGNYFEDTDIDDD